MTAVALPFVGPSYVYKNISFDAQRSVNLYPVRSETGTSRAPSALVPRPGLKAFITLPKSPIRAMRNVQGRGFVVAGNTLYEIFIDATFIARGTLNSSTGFVGISDNGFQVIMVDGPDGYIFTLATNAFTQITSPNWRGSNTVTFLDGYFVLSQPDTQVYYISGLYDGLTYDALEFASAEGSPDLITGVATIRREVWIFGRSTIQVATNTGGADFPLSIIQGAFVEYGCTAPQSIAKTANSLFWLGQDNDGDGVVWMATGYQPQRISTQAIEAYIKRQPNTENATAYTYQEDGHYFYCLTIPGAQTTLVYDVNEQQWHERAYWNNGTWSRHRADSHMFLYGKNLVGDYESGVIYDQNSDYLDDNGQVIRRERTLPNYLSALNYTYYHKFELDIETGFAPASGDGADTDPMIMLQASNDGGITWGNERWVSMGKIGEYRKRVQWYRTGRARDRVFRVAYTSRTKTILMASYVEAKVGSN